MTRDTIWEKVYRLVREIPAGRVMTYGQIAVYVEPLTARAVGWAMNKCPENVPWHRVVNSRGGCSTERLLYLPPGLQQALLEREGIEFQPNGTLDLKSYAWIPEPPPL
ncbi:MAG: MGMT family protein [Acidobacteriota bacterium]